jgi:hypothetical protein
LFYQLDGKRIEEQYVSHLSGFGQWDQLDHAQDWILFPDNIGPYLSIDETCLSQGELYTVITNCAPGQPNCKCHNAYRLGFDTGNTGMHATGPAF